MTRHVLLDRDLTHSWLDFTLGLAIQGLPVEDARAALHERLAQDQLGQTARVKTVTALLRTWITPPPEAHTAWGWALARGGSLPDSRPLHLGALLATQPFFADQMVIVGRILAVQRDIETPIVRTKMKALWGPRRSVDIAVQRTIKTMRSLELIAGEPSGSVSHASTPIPVSPEVAGWLVTCLLLARGTDSISLSEVGSAPEFAPLDLPRSIEGGAVLLERFTEGSGRTVLVRGAGG